jgi:hypothetical protein
VSIPLNAVPRPIATLVKSRLKVVCSGVLIFDNFTPVLHCSEAMAGRVVVCAGRRSSSVLSCLSFVRRSLAVQV